MAKAEKQLSKLNIDCYPVALPVKDCNLFFKDHGAEEFEQLLLKRMTIRTNQRVGKKKAEKPRKHEKLPGRMTDRGIDDQ